MVSHLDKIGMPDEDLNYFRKIIKAPNGIVVVTAHGLGQNHDAYAALNEANDGAVKIITTEDPGVRTTARFRCRLMTRSTEPSRPVCGRFASGPR